MHTLTPQLASATGYVARHAIGYHAAIAGTSVTGTGTGALIVIFVIIVLVAALGSAARGLAALLSEVLRVATALTSILFAVVVAIGLGVAILVH
jgi:hypothetical protein